MEKFDFINTSISVFGGGVTVFILSKLFGKSKADIELVLDYQKYYKGHIEILVKSNEAMGRKVDALTIQVKALLKDDKENKDTIISLRKTVGSYEKTCATYERKCNELSEALHREINSNKQ